MIRTGGPVAPVVRTLSLRCPCRHAFTAFTQRIGQWWPAGFTASGDALADVTIEGSAGGRVFETDAHGREFDWGSVSVWEPDRRLVQSWTLGVRTGAPTRLEVTFSADGDACRMRLEHGGWSPDQAADRARFDDPGGGWGVVLDAFKQHAEWRIDT